MRRLVLPLVLAAVLAPGSGRAAPAALVHHSLRVTLDPAGRLLEARDTVRFPEELLAREGRTLEFRLHDGLAPATTTPGAVLETLSRGGGEVPTVTCRLTVPAGVDTVEIRMRGVVHHPVTGEGEESPAGSRTRPASSARKASCSAPRRSGTPRSPARS